MKSWTQDHKSTSQVPQPLSHNVSNNAGKIHVNVTFTIVFHIYFKIQGEVKWRLKENYKDHWQTILKNYWTTRLELSQLSTRIKKPVIQNETINVSEKSWCMYHILLCLFSLLCSSPSFTFIKKKKNGFLLSFSTVILLYLITDRSHYQNI